jgi:chromosomal replication initiation ATPase DnaA
MSLKSVMDEPQSVEAPAEKDGALPSDDDVKAKWPELAKMYSDKPRLASMLTSTTLEITEADGFKTVVFKVVNDAQKDWVESKLLHELEGNFRKAVGSAKVYLRVAVAPDDGPQEKKIYMPSDQAAELMRQNEQVKNLVKDLELDIK